MRHCFLTLSLLLVVPSVTLTATSWAETADDTTTAVARARFKEGVDFYDKGDFEHARTSFLQAYALKKHPAVLLNLAWSCLKSGHPLEAQRYFKEFAADSTDASDKQRADVADGLTQTRAKLGRIDVVASNGTEVTIDGGRVGLAPLAEGVLVEPGAHTVKAKATDGAIEVQSVTVLAGEERAARFGGPAPAPSPPVTTTTPPPAAAPLPPQAALETRATEAPAPVAAAPSAAPTESSAKSLFPKNMVPVYVGGIITLAGAAAGIVMLEFKQSALDSASATVSNIVAQGRTCPPPSGSKDMVLANACSILASDNDSVNEDATIGNIAIGVAIAGLVGTATYWLLADKSEMPSRAAGQTVIAPIVGRSVGGLSVSGTF